MPTRGMRLPARLPQRDPFATPGVAAAGVGKVNPQYTIRVRDANLIPRGQLATWTAGDIMLRMNDVGKWAFTVKADDALRQYFATRGGGIIVSVDLGDGKGSQTVMSGPVWAIDRLGLDNYYTIGGPTDEWWLKCRNVLPQGGRPYMEVILRDAPVRYYRLDEASGTVAADSSLSAQAGTYTNAPTLGVAGGIPGDPDTAVTLAAASFQRITGGSASIAISNNPVSFEILFKFAANPGANQYIMDWGPGPRVNHQNIGVFVDSSGKLNADVGGAALLTSAAGMTTGVWHHIVVTWDGTTLRLYLDNVQVGTGATPGAQSTPAAGGFVIGCTTQALLPLSGSVDEGAAYNIALTAAQITAHYNAFTTTHGAYDTRTGVCSTVLLGYVNANLIAPSNLERRNSFITAALDPQIGTTISANARGDNLLALMQQLASSGGDIGFRVLQTANGVLTFSIYQPNDKTATAKFSQDLKNLFDFNYSLAGPISNSTEVWGGGVGAARSVVLVQDAVSIAAWGLVEGPILDARDTTDVPTMTQRGQANIFANTEQTNLAITPGDTGTIRYGRDYILGDIVNMTIDGNTITNKIRSVHIELKSPGDQELITPGIGNPTQGDVARWFDAYAARMQALNWVQQQINTIGTLQ